MKFIKFVRDVTIYTCSAITILTFVGIGKYLYDINNKPYQSLTRQEYIEQREIKIHKISGDS